jgi:hypothetical protein
MGEVVRVEVEDGLATLTLNRPQVLNALPDEVITREGTTEVHTLGIGRALTGLTAFSRATVTTSIGEP